MIGCFNLNGHDCNQSDLDTVSFVPLDVLEDAEIHRVGLEALIHYPLDDEEEGASPEPFDPQFEETFWLSNAGMLDNEDSMSEEEISAWVQARYATEIKLNDAIGYTPIRHDEQVVRTTDAAPSFYGVSRTNIGRINDWNEKYRPYKRRNGRKQTHGWKHYADVRYRSA